MLKAVNMKNYRFGELKNIMFVGFGIIDTQTNEFVSLDGNTPYVLDTKKIVQSVIDANCCDTMERVGAYAPIKIGGIK